MVFARYNYKLIDVIISSDNENGISDKQSAFHLLSLFLTSGQKRSKNYKNHNFLILAAHSIIFNVSSHDFSKAEIGKNSKLE